MNQNRNASNQDRGDEGYQNTGRVHRLYQNRPLGQNHPNLNPNYQNPVDLIRNYNRDRQLQQEPEENIYERLDDDDDEVVVSERNLPNNFANCRSEDNHTYERIDNRFWYRGGINNSRNNNSHNPHVPGPSALHDLDSRNFGQYDQPRNVYLDASRGISSQQCLSRLGRLGRNCFSTENIASTSNRRYIYQLGHNCMCQFCRHLDARYICHYCHTMHDRLRYQDAGNTGTIGNSRHYIYQVSRNCRCAFCRGESPYARFPINSARLSESFRRDCHCRNSANCTCRNRFLSSSNPAIYIGRIDRAAIAQTVNNPLYANPTIYVGRIERSCVAGLNNLAAGSNSTDSSASTLNPSTSNSNGDPCTSGTSRSIASTSGNPSTSNASVCPVNRSAERQHTCDDSCIRNPTGNSAGVYQFLGRCEKADCQHGRVSVHWWFVNKWLSPWMPQNSDRNPEPVPKEEESREEQESDNDDS
ncbi:uncharacterized protein LOC112494110 [Cephus cinctus]|uniref:Uncharacterized protein LOC112494110 n=1 Tax=Cephus cinctus TaxID=211228 RepID=A0AAJ7VZT6_CEPCN|nr:uncharacterized protein LOC112494110 [Cephus cinctus]